MKYIDGDLIKLAQQGKFDIIAHGCNCFNKQGKGLALQMNKAFRTNDPIAYPLEHENYLGDVDKLGRVQSNAGYILDGPDKGYHFYVANCYTQYKPGKNLDTQALTLCLRKLNHLYGNKDWHIGIPKIGCGIAGGDWYTVATIIKKELKDIEVTIVNYKK